MWNCEPNRSLVGRLVSAGRGWSWRALCIGWQRHHVGLHAVADGRHAVHSLFRCEEVVCRARARQTCPRGDSAGAPGVCWPTVDPLRAAARRSPLPGSDYVTGETPPSEVTSAANQRPRVRACSRRALVISVRVLDDRTDTYSRPRVQSRHAPAWGDGVRLVAVKFLQSD